MAFLSFIAYIIRDMNLIAKCGKMYDLRKYSFTSKIVNIWNSLPNWVVSAKLLTQLTHFKIHWIGFGRIRK